MIELKSTENKVYEHWLSAGEEQDSWTRKEWRRNKLGWLASRVAAKKGIMDWLQHKYNRTRVTPEDISIVRDQSGRPYVICPPEFGAVPKISISHKANIGLAAIAHDLNISVGCDIEFVSHLPANTHEYFTSRLEMSIWRTVLGKQTDGLFTVLWSIKEASIKSLSTMNHGVTNFLPSEIVTEPTVSNQNYGNFIFYLGNLKGYGAWVLVQNIVVSTCYLRM